MNIAKSLCSAIVPATLALALMAGPALAGEKKPPPPKERVDCSPGFYKNHIEEWDTECAVGGVFPPGGISATAFLALLSANMGATKAERDAAVAFLNACFEVSPCDDD